MITRDQRRAQHAYKSFASLQTKEQRDNYKVLVNGLGANILRSGLAATIAFFERENARSRTEAELLLEHLAKANIPGLEGTTATTLPDKVRKLELEQYILATREMLRVALWFRRAVQAGVPDPTPKGNNP
jgi:CRISPR-associated protein Cmr5